MPPAFKPCAGKGASDARPYTLLSAWVSFVPGVNTTDMTLEQGGHPLYGADNLANPWTNSQIMRVQAGYNPVLVADSDYWDANKLSDAAGDWPANVPTVQPNQTLTRTLDVYNDTFSGTAVDVFWELRQGATTGSIVASGQMHPQYNFGIRLHQFDQFYRFPNVTCGMEHYVIWFLYTQKSGVEMFRETAEQFVIKNESYAGRGAVRSQPGLSNWKRI